MNEIEIRNIRLYAHHGCLKEERIIGSDYRVSIWVHADLQKSAQSDLLTDTVDYVVINKWVQEEMAIPSDLLEHVAERILHRMKESTKIKYGKVEIAKINPPIEGDVEEVIIRMDKIFNN